MMIRIKAVTLLLMTLGFQSVNAQIKVPSILKQIPSSQTGQPSIEEIGSGIKEALQTGVSNSTSRLSAVNGFLNNPSVKIIFPAEAQKAEKTLRGLGFNDMCDNVIKSLNRAAEEAAKEALPIFMSSIKQMTFKDARNILLAKDQDAATQYFKTTTTSQLSEKFKPIIQSNLDKAGATKYWTTATSQYNKIPMTGKINTNLNDYVTQKALAGLYHEIAEEELKIRKNNSYRASPLLQKVFAYADKNN